MEIRNTKKYGKGGKFYYCPTDELYYYADKDEGKYYKLCPECDKYICPFCYYADDFRNNEVKCCIKGRIKHKFFYDIYYYISPKEIDIRGKEVEQKPLVYNYIPFIGLILFETNLASLFYFSLIRHKTNDIYGASNGELVSTIGIGFWIFISIPYFLYHYILVAALLLICIFSKKPFLYYCGIADRGSGFRLDYFFKDIRRFFNDKFSDCCCC